jgi:hypothetical protein
MKSEMHNYYKLASTITECKREGTLSVQKLEEIKQKFYIEIAETYATETQVQVDSSVQEEEVTEVNSLPSSCSYFQFICLLLAQQPSVDRGLLIHEVSRSHTLMHHSW